MTEAPSRWKQAAAAALAMTALCPALTGLAAGALERAGAEFITGGLGVCAAAGLLSGALLGWRYGNLGLFYPALTFPALYGALLTGRLDGFWAGTVAVMSFALPAFSTAGVLLGSLCRRARGTPESAPWIYPQTLLALLLANAGMLVVSTHLSSLLPAPAGEAVPVWLARLFLVWRLLYFAAVLWWVRPIHQAAARGREDAKPLARRRAAGIYGFLAALTAAWYVPELVHGLLQTRPFSLGGASLVLLRCAVEAYYLAYLTILILEPYLMARVLPALYAGEELLGRKPAGALSIRLKLWLMVASLAAAPMLLVIASLVANYRSLSAVWPVPALIMILSLGCLVGYCEVLYQSITRPLGELMRRMDQVAEGDFATRTSVLADDELGHIKSRFNEMVSGLAERERIKDTFGRYVSIEIARQLIDSGRIELGGEDIEATILFSDIRNFTPMSERMPAKAVVDLLNAYFAHVTVPIMANRGVINKFMGDAVMGIFAPQFGSADHADDALKAVLGMRRALAEFNSKRPVPEEVRFGIGLHTGSLVAGNIGTESRLEYTVIGDTVNIASRIESENKPLGSTILISGATYAKLSPGTRALASFEKCEGVLMKGKREPLVLYRVL